MARFKIPVFYFLCFTVIGFASFGCSSTTFYQQNTTEQTPQGEPIYSVYLIGDTGAPSIEPQEPILGVLEAQLKRSGEQSAVIFLGDNVYPDGLPPKQSPSRAQAEKRLLTQLKIIDDYPGQVVFIPGNHDWASSEKNGLKQLRRQEKYIESYLNRGNTFLPDSGNSGPVLLNLATANTHPDINFDIQLVAIDTQWWLHKHEKPLWKNVDSANQQKEKILTKLEEMITADLDAETLVAAHHPLFSFGRHGGKFPNSTHFLPPVFGSLYVAYRNIWGYPQDIASYSNLKEGMLHSFKDKPGLIYASGHEHSLQFIPYLNGSRQQYHLVSGSATKPSFVKKGSGDSFTYRGKGFITSTLL
ncbi:metallophosphoesterase [Fodinibius sp.]|uniref:metallophosphoesterase n=1 Tax=Fodinibius sp. TaxID=1872440 RepID=UPI002ACDD499|nr:metallophosphoesterase [Fodinibius sp.]MDZ7659020.1 metallophosphoesterase [Fodinibius sp.]